MGSTNETEGIRASLWLHDWGWNSARKLQTSRVGNIGEWGRWQALGEVTDDMCGEFEEYEIWQHHLKHRWNSWQIDQLYVLWENLSCQLWFIFGLYMVIYMRVPGIPLSYGLCYIQWHTLCWIVVGEDLCNVQIEWTLLPSVIYQMVRSHVFVRLKRGWSELDNALAGTYIIRYLLSFGLVGR